MSLACFLSFFEPGIVSRRGRSAVVGFLQCLDCVGGALVPTKAEESRIDGRQPEAQHFSSWIVHVLRKFVYDGNISLLKRMSA
jgi:hypothetical protein